MEGKLKFLTTFWATFEFTRFNSDFAHTQYIVYEFDDNFRIKRKRKNIKIHNIF